VSSSFPADRGEAAASVRGLTFAAQTIENETINVRTAALPDEGHLAVQAIVNETRGAILGSIPLEAGTHRNVSAPVEVDRLTEPNTTAAVLAIAYGDDGNGRLDAGDRPVTVGSEPVGTHLVIQRPPTRRPRTRRPLRRT
jgi:hypothetical protein